MSRSPTHPDASAARPRAAHLPLRLVLPCLCLLAACLALFPLRAAHAHDDSGEKIDVVLQGAPAGPNEAGFTATLTPHAQAAALQLQWQLPPGVELVGGPAAVAWSNPPVDGAQSEARHIRVPGPGVYPIAVGGRLDGGGQSWVQGATLYLIAADDGTVTLTRQDPARAQLRGSVMSTSIEPMLGAAVAHAPNGDPCFNVSGTVMREEHTPFRSGYQPLVYVPVRSAVLQMREEDTLFDDTYGEVLTGNDGSFAFSFCDDDGLFDDELEIYVQLTAEIQSAGHDVVEVQEDGFVEDVYDFKSRVIESEGGTYTLNLQLDRDQSAIFNIADAIFDAWNVWNANGGAVGDDAIFDYQAEVNWERDDDDDKTYYNGNIWDEITVADANSNPDEWDDGVIIHEWTHQADDNYGCDDNPGGPHSSRDNAQDPELSFAEGFANYYQSAVRNAVGRVDSNFYLDGLGPGGMMGGYDMEAWDTNNPTLVTDRNEAAVAALLWDLEDAAQDGQDRASFGLRANQETFTDPTFSENGDIFDDTCTTWVYLESWREIGKQADRATAAIIQQNVGFTNFYGNSVAAAYVPGTSQVPGTFTAATVPTQSDVKWWKNLTWVVDTSASMADANKLASVKTVMKEQVNDLSSIPKGTEFNVYTFNNTTSALQQPVQRKFYADLANPAIDSLATIGGPDGDCDVAALSAIAQAAQLQPNGDIWLYTDRAARLIGPNTLSVDSVRRLLNQQGVRGSFAMLGGCAGVLPARMSDVTGGEINYLGSAANGSQSTGIVPYLLTALGTGGQFIYVREDQLGSAADILRAQVANSAGAGKWSDYVSDSFTYRWDRLEAGEYQWFPAESLGQAVDQIPATGYVSYDLPTEFPFHGSKWTKVGVNQDGVIEFNPCGSPCSIIRIVRAFLDPLATDMQWDFIPYPPALAGTASAAAAAQPSTDPDAVLTPNNAAACPRLFGPLNQRLPGPQVCVFQANLGFEWHIISIQGYDSTGRYRAYQVWLNTNTGEIRFQYGNVYSEPSTAQIGLRRSFPIQFPPSTDALVVSNRDSAGAYNGMGYKFTPAPPQPTRTYTVAVDALMDGVGFLQTGYGGRFEPMIVRDPADNPVNCGDTANVLCLTMDNAAGDRMVQYVQVNVNGNVGDWTATVDAQAGAEGTFTFTGLAASSIAASTVGERSLPSAGAVRIALKLGAAVDNNVLTGWLQRPNGERFGASFQLFDDGVHGDGRAGDGLFALPDFPAQGKGAGFLWVQGSIGGQGFVRSDPVPYNFQPLEVTALTKDLAYTGAVVPVWFQIKNLDSRQQCFYYGDRVTLPDGWSAYWTIPPGDDGSEQFFGVCISAGGTIERQLNIIPSGEFDAGPSLASGEVAVMFVERERGAISDGDTVTVTRYREPLKITVLNVLGDSALRPNGVDTATLTVEVYDYTGTPIQDGTLVEITTDLGTVEPAPVAALAAASAAAPAASSYTGDLTDGKEVVTLVAGTQPGDATVTATVNGKTAATVVHIRAASVHTIDLVASPTDLSGGATTSTLVATVRDKWGAPVPGVNARIGIADDAGSQGSLNGGADMLTGVTDAKGQFAVIFTKTSGATGQVVASADYLAQKDGQLQVIDDAAVTLALAPIRRNLYLPAVRK